MSEESYSPDDLDSLLLPKLDQSLGCRVVLASGSPYRQKLLREAGVEFTVEVSHIDESLQPHDEPERYARGLALRKAQSVAARIDNALVIGADTICAIGKQIIGKPRDEAHAVDILSRACAAGVQRVITGCCVIDTRDMKTAAESVSSLVEMRPVPTEIIRAYVKTGEPMGKCGALCIEGNHDFIKRFTGSYSNIIGLPLEWLLPTLIAFAERRAERQIEA